MAWRRMKATGLIGDLHRAVANYENGNATNGSLRLRSIMDLVLAITRGKIITWWSDEPEVPFLRSLFEKSHPIWNYLTLKTATKFARDLEAKKIVPVLREQYEYESLERVIVISEPRESATVRNCHGIKPDKVVLALDCETPGGVLYYITITP